MAFGLLRIPALTRSPSRKSEKGATALEMALLAPSFFLLMIGIVELSLVVVAQQLLENAAFNTSRLAKTGYVAAGQTQLQTVTSILNQELSSYGTFINTNSISMTSVAYTSFSAIGQNNQGTNGLGTPQQIVVYTVSYPWTLITPLMNYVIGTNGVVNLTTQIVVRNEPYG